MERLSSNIRTLRGIFAPFFALLLLFAASCDNSNNNGVAPPDVGDPQHPPVYIGNPPVIINEIAPINNSYEDAYGDTPGWVELYNPANTAVNLRGYYLTNNATRKMWVFGNVVVAPQSYQIVFFSGRNVPDLAQSSAGIELLQRATSAYTWSDIQPDPPRPAGGSTVIPNYNINALANGFGAQLNSVDNRPAFDWSTAMAFLQFTTQHAATNHVDLSDMEEIVFRGFITHGRTLEIRIAAAGVNDWEAWQTQLVGTGIQNYEYSVKLPPKGSTGVEDLSRVWGIRFSNVWNHYGTIDFNFNSIYARARKGELHATFRLGANGGSIFLMDAQNNIRDSVEYGAGTLGFSHALSQSGAWLLSKPPTPAAANEGDLYETISPPPAEGSIPESGYHGSDMSFTIPSGNGGVIRCDTTGREPVATSQIASGTTVTLTRSAVLRCAQFAANAHVSPSIMRTYIVGRALPTLPIVSIAVDPIAMFDSTTGLYMMGPNAQPDEPYYGANFWAETELPIHIDFFEGGAQHKWNHPAGIRIFGNYSRSTPKKSVLISFRSEYGGPNRLDYPLFPSHPHLTRFKHFLLRNNGNNAGLDYIRDMLMSSLTEGLDIEYQKGRAAIVFYNGRYFGIHNIRERSNGDYFETNFGVNENFIDLVKAGGEVSSGSDADYQSIISWLTPMSGLSDASLAQLKTRIDVDNYTSYIQSQIFFNNRDWPGNNLKRWRVSSPASRWRWLIYDTDHGWGSFGKDNQTHLTMLEFAAAPNGPEWPNPPHSTFLTRKLLENQSYRNAFVNRFSILLATNFATSASLARIDALMAPIESEIPLDIERWRGEGGGWRWNPYTVDEWYSTMITFARNRPAQMQSEIERFFNISGGVDFTVTSTVGGDVFVHDLKVADGGVTFRAYAQVPIVLRAVPQAGYVFDSWSDGNTNPDRAFTATNVRTLEARFRQR